MKRSQGYVRKILQFVNCGLICLLLIVFVLYGAFEVSIIKREIVPIIFILSVSAGLAETYLRKLDKVERYSITASHSQELQGAHRYEISHCKIQDLLNSFVKEISDDGFKYAGAIENSYSANMTVFVRNLTRKREIVLIIETDEFSMDLLVNHMRLLKEFIANYSGDLKLKRLKRLRTVVYTSSMTLPLKILLTALDLRKDMSMLSEQEPQVFAVLGNEKKVYASAHRSRLSPVPQKLWLNKYLINPPDQKPEHVWKGIGWSVLLFLDWTDGNYNGSYRYDSSARDIGEFTQNMKDRLLMDGYENAGEIRNDLSARMDVYVLNNQTVDKEEAVLFIEADLFTKDMFHQYNYLMKEYLKDYLHDAEFRWHNSTRIVIAVREMSTPLRILLSVFTVFPSRQAGYICSYIEEESKIYTMADTDDEFFSTHLSWVREYLPETSQQKPEHLWEGLEWRKLDGLPLRKLEMIAKFNEALNVWKEGRSFYPR